MKAVLGKSREISISSTADAANICLEGGVSLLVVGVLSDECNFFSVCERAEPGVINDNELYFLGTASLMEEIGRRE